MGVCGFCVPQTELFRRFRLLEVQQTFYKPPQRKTVQRWRQLASEGFEFTLKAYQVITHAGYSPTYRKTKLTAQQLKECGGFCDSPLVREAWETTRILAADLAATYVVFQCPPKFDASPKNVAQLRGFFHTAMRDSLRFVWEPRHATWTPNLIESLCHELDLIHAVDPLESTSVFGTPRYFRLHGKALGQYRYDYDHPYSEAELDLIYRSCSEVSTYCLFNNKQMATDAERFERLAPSSGPSLDY